MSYEDKGRKRNIWKVITIKKLLDHLTNCVEELESVFLKKIFKYYESSLNFLEYKKM